MLKPCRLEGPTLSLVPLTPEHSDALCAIGLDPELWEFTAVRVQTAEEMRRYVEIAAAAASTGSTLPFAIVHRPTDEIVGTTRLHSYVPMHRRVEIGFTWIARAWQGTYVNAESKFMLLSHAFGPVACQRVQFMTDHENERSQRALRRLGAVHEATLRHYVYSEHRGPRDMDLFRILAEEWPDVRTRLEDVLRRTLPPDVIG
jgi:RimJ/RimL family protein N-acetyltransferase